jgi:hypothetical protein
MSKIRSVVFSLGALAAFSISSNALACGGEGDGKPKDDSKKPSMLCDGEGKDGKKPSVACDGDDKDGKKPSMLCDGDDKDGKKPSLN